ncbi:cystathionine gamma-synthase [Phlegmacium glaucopus]|nr:cystathionine gamma-synthase [Phlegmacium glaucopus]
MTFMRGLMLAFTLGVRAVSILSRMADIKPKLNGTHLIHGDSVSGREVAPSISVSTTFRAPNPTETDGSSLADIDMRNPSRHVYSRYTQQVSTRVEQILSSINDGFALTYSSGLAASYAALVFYRPKRIAIRGGYHGCHATIAVYRAQTPKVDVIDLDSEYRPGDLCWLETPVNPTGESRDIQYYADKVHKVGGKIIVDSTFAPPPLQYPFKFGADCVLHSGTKYFGGHSDLLAGILVVKTLESWNQLHSDRTFLGSMMGSLESWLLLRSLRTLHLRVPRQSASATELAQWLNIASETPVGETYDGVPGGMISKVWHSALQGPDERGFDPKTQMQGGWNATFAILLAKSEHALIFPHLLQYFPATSLGGVESLVEQRLQSDPSADPRLIRLSIGVEDVEDLRSDLRQAFQRLASVKAKL